jgi:hypothetical protein
MKTRWPLVFVVLCLALGWAAQVPAVDVGNFTRVLNQVDLLKKGQGPALPAKVPSGVENQDLVRTHEQSMAVVTFMDDSNVTISPKSKVTIEDYMYDASKGQTKGAIKVFEGVIETVVPNTDKVQQMNIKIFTTTAVAGIRD